MRRPQTAGRAPPRMQQLNVVGESAARVDTLEPQQYVVATVCIRAHVR